MLEVCVNSVNSAIEAQKGGASRVELCENMADGGCTPSAGSIALAKKMLTIPVHVMIRPRGADFCYNDTEFDIMKKDILEARKLGADGLVFGILDRDGQVDLLRMKQLMELSFPLPVTFHRAFDMTPDPMHSLEDLITLGLTTILTSGQAENASAGAPLIRKLIGKAHDRIKIMPGGGIKEHNFADIIRATKAEIFHVNLTHSVPSVMKYIREGIFMGHPGQSEYTITQTDANRVREMVNIKNNAL